MHLERLNSGGFQVSKEDRVIEDPFEDLKEHNLPIYSFLENARVFARDHNLDPNKFSTSIVRFLHSTLYHIQFGVLEEDLIYITNKSPNIPPYLWSTLAIYEISFGHIDKAQSLFEQIIQQKKDVGDEYHVQKYAWIRQNINNFLNDTSQFSYQTNYAILDRFKTMQHIAEVSRLLNDFQQRHRTDYFEKEREQARAIESEYLERIRQLKKEMEEKVESIKEPRIQSERALLSKLEPIISIGEQRQLPNIQIGFRFQTVLTLLEYSLNRHLNAYYFLADAEKTRKIIHSQIRLPTVHGKKISDNDEPRLLFSEEEVEKSSVLLAAQENFIKAIQISLSNHFNSSEDDINHATKTFEETLKILDELDAAGFSPEAIRALRELIFYLTTPEGTQMIKDLSNAKRYFRPIRKPYEQ